MFSYTDWITRKILHVKDIKGPSGFIFQDICNKLGNSPSRIMQAVCRLLLFLDEHLLSSWLGVKHQLTTTTCSVRFEPRTMEGSFALTRPQRCWCLWCFVVYNSWLMMMMITIITIGTAIIIILAVSEISVQCFSLIRISYSYTSDWPAIRKDERSLYIFSFPERLLIVHPYVCALDASSLYTPLKLLWRARGDVRYRQQ